LWFGKDPKHDSFVTSEFQKDFLKLKDEVNSEHFGEYVNLHNTSRGGLALVLLAEQIPKFLYRNTKEAIDFNSGAVLLSFLSMENGTLDEGKLDPIERSFFYVPLIHSLFPQNGISQDLAVSHLQKMYYQSPLPYRPYFISLIRYAERHRLLMERFGSFPHHNDLNQRHTTPQEANYRRLLALNFQHYKLKQRPWSALADFNQTPPPLNIDPIPRSPSASP